MEETVDALPAGTILGEFEITRILGQGGFGITYLARDQKLDRQVVLKEFFPEELAMRGKRGEVVANSRSRVKILAELRDRFLREARILANFRHSGIVHIHQVLDSFNSNAYIVMDYLEGRTLEDAVAADGPIPYERFRPIFFKMADAVRLVHQYGIQHRDIKPTNVMLTNGDEPVLIDFGAARERRSGTKSSASRMYTPGYAPPEQSSADSEEGPFTDIYAIAATTYFALTGELPDVATFRYAAGTESFFVQRTKGMVPPEFARAMEWALELEPERRPQSIDAWLETIPDEQPHIKMDRRKAMLLGLGLGGIAVAGGAAWWIISPGQRSTVTSSSRPIKSIGSRDFGMAVASYPEGRIAATKGGTAFVTNEGSTADDVRLSFSGLDQMLGPRGAKYLCSEPSSYGRALIALPDGTSIVGGASNVMGSSGDGSNTSSKALICRVSADGSQMWLRSPGGGSVNDIAHVGDQLLLVLGAVGVDDTIASVVRLGLDGNQIGNPLEIGRRSRESVQRIVAAGSDSIVTLSSRIRPEGKGLSTVVTKFKLSAEEAIEVWSYSDEHWMEGQSIRYSQPTDMIAVNGDLFISGRANPASVKDGFEVPYLMRIDGDAGTLRWARAESLAGEGAGQPLGDVSLALDADSTPRLYAAYYGPAGEGKSGGVSRVFQIGSDGATVNQVELGKAETPFWIQSLAFDAEGGFALGFKPSGSAMQAVIHRLAWD